MAIDLAHRSLRQLMPGHVSADRSGKIVVEKGSDAIYLLPGLIDPNVFP